ncbi:MAG: carboxypeptidase-like regulatory domain-containing protein [Bacteroidetes bacterium]|nr:carboxypeptidase-like regulatory domain-containing protein [Bacteroidota bacterium]
MIPSCYPEIQPKEEKTSIGKILIYTSLSRSLVLFAWLFLFFGFSAAAQQTILDQKITISRQHSSLYDALNVVSDKAGCLFIYDSQVLENSKRVKLEADDLPLKQVLDKLLANPELAYKVIGKHILIYKAGNSGTEAPISNPAPVPDTIKKYALIRGNVYDNQSRKPIPFVSVGIEEFNQGTVTNNDGFFILKVPQEQRNTLLMLSHIGYMSQSLPLELLDDQHVDIYLERRVISIQEVIIRYLDPVTILTKALEERKLNNNTEPVIMTDFYREGVFKDENVISFSEAVFKVYKSSFRLGEYADQVKLMKSRKVQNANSGDTVLLKLKAGILAGLQLDIVKSLPGFLDPAQFQDYTYTYSDIVSYNDQDAYAITFSQNKEITDALFMGTLYIDNESFAILGADFEVNPKYIDKAAPELIQKKSRKLKVKFDKISYSVSYSNYNGKYYLNHAKSELQLRTRYRNHLSFSKFNTFMEIATCHIDTLNIRRFERQEVIKPDIVFSDAPYSYDELFWGEYNFIAPEEKLGDALSKIIGKIEKIE